MGFFKDKNIGSHVGASGERMYDGDNNRKEIPQQTGKCKNYEDHNFTTIGTVTVGGVTLKKVRCRIPSCGFETTTPAD